MLRKRAVRSLLVEDVAGLRVVLEETDDEGEPQPAATIVAAELDAQRAALQGAVRRGWRAVAFDWAAIAALLVFRDPALAHLPLDGTVETLFTVGILMVAVHSGFRLGQIEKYWAILRAVDDLG